MPMGFFKTNPELTDQMFDDELSRAGWLKETLHGKPLLICPSCKRK